MKKEFPWGVYDELSSENAEAYSRWRGEHVQNARKWADGDFALFIDNRLSFQRGTRGVEIEDYQPWENPEQALFDTFLTLRGEEYDAWTEEERQKINNVMCALISATFDELRHTRYKSFIEEGDTMNSFFDYKPSVTLSDEEANALSVILKRVGREIDPNERFFRKPYTGV